MIKKKTVKKEVKVEIEQLGNISTQGTQVEDKVKELIDVVNKLNGF